MANAPVGGIRQTSGAADSSSFRPIWRALQRGADAGVVLSDATVEASRSKGHPNENQAPGPRAARDDGKCCQRTRLHAAPCRRTAAAISRRTSNTCVGAARSKPPFMGRNPPARARPLLASPRVCPCRRSRFNALSVGRRYGASGQHERDGGESGDRGRWLQGRSRARPRIRRRVEGKRAARSNRSAAERQPDGQRIGKLTGGIIRHRRLDASNGRF